MFEKSLERNSSNYSLEEVLELAGVRSFTLNDLRSVLSDKLKEGQITFSEEELATALIKIGAEELWNRLGRPDIQEIYSLNEKLNNSHWREFTFQKHLKL
ncbi:MAG: hypothetical protein UT13_C0001G0764 [Candidatus Pacebacteria bacterium GW2011_GWF2_38_9]|nr:MAG: hypothetical protein US01_C0001G0799 [candidate division TM6 bacterium GW2011_GWF2_28_16]KKQ08853.1 MAG: hypothetical protein US20_C0011G0022 [Candidatus Pacebacteria bacterium GW2011_GWF1_36_5]KKQ89116.1 MAG: hypothetical protein UT13_C0001G0764 [Candidatus Pacebacteria bacterium GW2011_GWF2_38_9]HAZ73616.1 hypothetical protein [Candidatus Paceibacterota bacterium]